MFTCATCSRSSGRPFTLFCISLISCWYSFLRCSSCFLHSAHRVQQMVPLHLTSPPCCSSSLLMCFFPPPYLNSRSLLWWVCDRARWGSLAWARLDTTRCSFFSLCLCFSLQRSSSSSAFFLCSSTFLLGGDSPVTRAGGFRVGQGSRRIGDGWLRVRVGATRGGDSVGGRVTRGCPLNRSRRCLCQLGWWKPLES